MRFRQTLEPGSKISVKNAYSRRSARGIVTRIFSGEENPQVKVEYRGYDNGGLYICNLEQVRPLVPKMRRKRRHEAEEEEYVD